MRYFRRGGHEIQNLRIGNGIELGKFQLCLLPPFCILPTLWMLPGRSGSKVLGRTTQFTCWGITVSTHLAAILANVIQFSDAQTGSALASGPPRSSTSIRGCERLPLIRGTAGHANRATYT